MRAFLPELVYHQDEPIADWTACRSTSSRELARETGTIVVQVGEGADELFHGYQGYVDHRRVVVPFQRWVPRAIRRPHGRRGRARDVASGARGPPRRGALRRGHSRVPYWGGALCFRGPLKERLLRHGHQDALRTVERIWDEGERPPRRRRYLPAHELPRARQRLPELLLARMDRIAMASSVEGREPFLDHELVEFAMALPPDMKYRDGQGKHVLREAMRDALPPAVLAAPSRASAVRWRSGCAAPSASDAQAAVRGSALAEREPARLRRGRPSVRRPSPGPRRLEQAPWNLYCVSRWYDRWVAERRPRARRRPRRRPPWRGG